jgi:hypothetical protein
MATHRGEVFSGAVLSTAAAARAAVPPPPPELSATVCAGDRPLALFPVRLETRFFQLPDNTSELRVRVYPDKIHIDSHETELLPGEREWGEHYWTQIWRAGIDMQLQENAWRQLEGRFDAQRAGWIARAMRPVNLDDKPNQVTPADSPLTSKPRFPNVSVVDDGQDVAWRHAAHARMLPDRWIAIVHSQGRAAIVVVGNDIKQRSLPVGPDPSAPPQDMAGDQLAIDPGMRWMVDFDVAEAAGMALRIPLPVALTDTLMIEALFVLGAAGDLDAQHGAAEMSRVLDAHHYTDGLAFLRNGTPTNNTTEQRSGYHTDGWLTADTGLSTALDHASNAHRLGTALGLPQNEIAPVLGNTLNGAASHERDLASMNTSLWQASWGYFLSNMIGMEGTGLTPELLAWTRAHFVSHVRSAGPYPALRCGRQPYGILPVTSLDLWQAPAEQDAAFAPDLWLRNFLTSLRDNVWRPRVIDVPRLGRSAPDADLADVMRTEATSVAYRARTLLGQHYLENLRSFMGESLQATGFNTIHDALTSGILQRLGFGWRSRLSKGTYGDLLLKVTAPLVQASDAGVSLTPNYIAALLSEQIVPMLDRELPHGTSLLEALLRHALLLEYAHAAAAIASSTAPETLPSLLRDAELVDLVTGAPLTQTFRRQLDLSVPMTGEKRIGAYLDDLDDFDTPQTASLGEARDALKHLQHLDSECLQYLMQGTIDLAAHRLDAWITSFATKRLASMRATQAQGLYVGGYGWVENLRPDLTNRSAKPVTPTPTGESGIIYGQPNDSGFIHAPSMTHAATAALLRNAHLGASGVPQANSPFAIELSSRRLRDANWLLDGVRQGQPLGALLGYRIERRLHELKLDKYIQMLRQLAPLTAGKLEQTSEPVENIAANNVVDGLVLREKWSTQAASVTAQLMALPNANTVDVGKIGKELDALVDTIDGVSDALTAETAYQLVRGNASRLASTLSSIASGDAPAPELEVGRTPRTGTALTHRVVQLFSGKPAATTGWAAVSTSARAAAEPMLNAWAAKLMGDPRKIRCTVEQIDDVGVVIESRKVLLSALTLAPLDVVYGIDLQPRTGQLSQIEQRAVYEARRADPALPADAIMRIQHARPADLKAGELTLLDAIEQARAALRLLSSARSADPDDLVPPERGDAGTTNLTEFAARVVKAEKALQTATKALDTLVKKGEAATAESLRKALIKLASFGIVGAIPTAAIGDDASTRANVLTHAIAILKEGKARVEQVMLGSAAELAADERPRRDQLRERMRQVFGSAFLAMPQFTCAQGSEVKSALAASAQVQGGDALQVYTWFTRNTRVREPLARLGAALNGAEVLATGEKLNLRVAQLPFVADDRWVGLPASDGEQVRAGKLSLIVQGVTNLDPTQPLMGVLVDEWVETVPNEKETTAIAFQYNPPDACAPQSILLAVPPVLGQEWTVSTLYRVLLETLDLAKLRGVDVESLTEVGHYLPAMFLGFNENGETASTDFASLT